MIEHIQVVPDKCRACRRCEVACIAAHHGMSFKEAMKHRDVLVSRVQVVKAEALLQCLPHQRAATGGGRPHHHARAIMRGL